MILRVDPKAALPVYEQIRQQVTRMAVVGTLATGTRLPTIRQLASDLGIAKGTVAKAYTLLENASVVESRGHKGTFVLDLSDAADSVTDLDALDDAAEAFVVAARQHGLTEAQASAAIERAWQRL